MTFVQVYTSACSHVQAVPDIPYTISGKKVELAVRCVVLGQEVKNKDALKNPEARMLIEDLSEAYLY